MRNLTVSNIFLLLISSLLMSCGGLKVSGASKATKLYEVFYIKNGVTQYFVKPLKLKENKVKFSTDFTIRRLEPG